MADLFSQDWMQQFKEAWNREPELAGALEKIDFNSTIGYGFPDEPEPKGYIRVEHGKVIEAGPYSGQDLSWDLRADQDNWQKWLSKEMGMASLGMAATTGKLKFRKGDYGAMIKDPRMAGPFVKSFSVMGKVH
jgi:hypothetical protein